MLWSCWLLWKLGSTLLEEIGWFHQGEGGQLPPAAPSYLWPGGPFLGPCSQMRKQRSQAPLADRDGGEDHVRATQSHWFPNGNKTLWGKLALLFSKIKVQRADKLTWTSGKEGRIHIHTQIPSGSYAQRVFPRPAGQSGLSPKCPWHWSFKVSSLEVYSCQEALSKCAWVGRSKKGELHWKNSTVCGEGECRDHIEYTRERHGSLNTRPATNELSLWFGQSLGNLDGVQPQEEQVREPSLNKRGRERRRGKWGSLISWYTSLFCQYK